MSRPVSSRNASASPTTTNGAVTSHHGIEQRDGDATEQHEHAEADARGDPGLAPAARARPRARPPAPPAGRRRRSRLRRTPTQSTMPPSAHASTSGRRSGSRSYRAPNPRRGRLGPSRPHACDEQVRQPPPGSRRGWIVVARTRLSGSGQWRARTIQPAAPSRTPSGVTYGSSAASTAAIARSTASAGASENSVRPMPVFCRKLATSVGRAAPAEQDRLVEWIDGHVVVAGVGQHVAHVVGVAQRERSRRARRARRRAAERAGRRRGAGTAIHSLAISSCQHTKTSRPSSRSDAPDVRERGDRVVEEHHAEPAHRDVDRPRLEAPGLRVADLEAHVVEVLAAGPGSRRLDHGARDVEARARDRSSRRGPRHTWSARCRSRCRAPARPARSPRPRAVGWRTGASIRS